MTSHTHLNAMARAMYEGQHHEADATCTPWDSTEPVMERVRNLWLRRSEDALAALTEAGYRVVPDESKEN